MFARSDNRSPWGRASAPTVISIIALVFAMLGGAYAANKDSAGSEANASAKKVVKGPRGPRGKTGPAGTAGPAGPAGAKGETGAAGSNGSNGTNGADGADGVNGEDGLSVISTPIPPGEEACDELGGSEFEVEESGEQTFACNGNPAEFPATLPGGVTETGFWALPSTASPEGGYLASVSFPIPLAGNIEGSKTLIEGVDPEVTFDEHCEGAAASPTAESGYLCVYVKGTINVTLSTLGEIEETGGSVELEVTPTEESTFTFLEIVWAVTG